MSLPDLSHLPPASQDALLNGPALAPPANVEPNFEDPPNGNDFSIAIIYLCIFISSLLVMIRLYVSWFISRKIFVSDIMLILSFGLGIAYYGVVLDSIYHVGYLVHQWDVRLRDMIYMLRSFIITPTLYGFSIMFIKLAIVLEWLRIFNPRGVRDIFYWTSHAIVSINLIFYPVAAFILNLACRPFEKFWNPFVPGTCYNPYSTYVAAGVVNFVVDVMILLLPQKVIWGLQIPAKKKLGVAAIFAVGLFAIVSAGFRLVWTVQYVTSDDMLYRLTALGLWTMAEMTCGIIIFCVPSIPKAFGSLQFPRLAPSLKFWTRSSEGKSQASRAGTSSSGVGYKRGAPRPYQKLEGPGQIPLRNLESVTNSKLHLPSSQRSHLQQNDSAILRTTQFSTTSYEDITRGTTNDQFNHQHPWTSISR